MGGVYCPTCEAGVEVTAKFCLSCGHDLSLQGPITATGHDLNQLKDVIRIRDDLSMAQKFDMIAQVEDGADPIALGIAAAADVGESALNEAFEAPTSAMEIAPALQNINWGNSAADAAIDAIASSQVGDLKAAGTFDLENEVFVEAMDLGLKASIHLIQASQGDPQALTSEALKSVPIMVPPKKSFCPKCGSDIHANALLQWKKWTETAHSFLAMQLEASMKTSLMYLSSTYQDKIQDLKDQLSDAKSATAPASEVDEEKLRKKIEKEIRKELEAEAKTSASSSKGKGAASTASKPKKSSAPTKPKAKSGGMFGAKKPKKTYEGEPGGKAEWFLEEALDTVYDPHGTGKPIKAAMILARSSEGNVRVRDVVRAYAVEGMDGISELAHTSPLTDYLIQAFDAC
ncbi:hypothetical protein [Candidatus Poseidonia alphae]|uniref:hypothetical protein n=1 Tax=Candidatus Poseidonia alphae TaxID=1915863 RepID=UPI0030C6C6B0